MNNSLLRRLARRTTAIGAGAALVAAGLSLGVTAPAHAAVGLTGQLVDAQGNPAEGRVAIYRQQGDSSFTTYSTATLDNGTFTRTSYPAGVYKFQYSSVDASYTEFFRDKADLGSADAVTVADGTTANLGTWTVEQPLVTGTVTDPSGRPVGNAQVTAYNTSTQTRINSDSTDDQGRFYVPVGSAPVKIHVASYRYDLSDEWYNDKPTFATADAVSGSAAGTNLAIALAPAGKITGQVTNDAGVPLEYVEVWTVSDSSYSENVDVTDKNGVYVIENVPTGNFDIWFYDPIGEYDDEYYNNVQTRAEATEVTVSPGQVVSGINANLTPEPAQVPAPTVEVSGAVRDDAGAPLVGVPVHAWSTPNGAASEKIVETVRSNRQGVYSFTELDQVAGENQFKIEAAPSDGYTPGDENAFRVFDSWYGGKTDYDRSPVVTVPAAGADISLLRAGGIEGSVTGVAGLGLSGSATLLDADGDNVGGAATKADNTFKSRSIYPGTYKVQFADNQGNHAAEWWKDATFADARTITVKPGQMVSGLNAVLAATLSTDERPEVKNYPWVGKPVSATSGSWNLSSGTTYTYEWLNGSTVVGNGATFTPSKSLIGKRLVVRVTAENGKLVGTSTTAQTAKVGYKPKIKAKVKGSSVTFKIKAKPVKGKKVKGTVVAKEIVKVKKNGKIKYKLLGKTKIKKGQGKLSLGKLKKGKHKVVFFFKGKGKVGSNDIKRKIKR